VAQAWIITSVLAILAYLFLVGDPDKDFRLFLPSNLVSVYYLTSFGAGVLFYTTSNYTSENPTAFSIAKVGWIAILGLLSLKISAQSILRIRRAHSAEITCNVIGFFGTPQLILYLTLGWFCRIQLISVGRFFHTSSIDYSAATNQVSFLISTLATLPLIVLFSIFLKSKYMNLRVPRAFYILLISELVYQLATGSRQAFLAPFVGFLYLYSRFSKSKIHIPFAGKIVFGSLVPVIFAYIGIYRTVMVERGFGITDALNYSFGTLFKSGIIHGFWEGFNSIFQRSTDVISFSMAVSLPPTALSDVLHNPFAEIPYALIPRLIFPGKTDISNIGNRFGRSIGLVNGIDFHTSVNFPHILEGFLFSGYLGVIAVCGLSGILYGYMDSILKSTKRQYIHCVFAASALDIFNSPAQIVAHGLIGLIKYGLAIILILSLFDAISMKLKLSGGAARAES
jgi:hypothetical protein